MNFVLFLLVCLYFVVCPFEYLGHSGKQEKREAGVWPVQITKQMSRDVNFTRVAPADVMLQEED